MATLKRGKPRASGRGHAAPGKRRRRAPPDVAPNAPPADGDDATLAVAPTFEIEAVQRNPALEGAVDDWAGMDTVADTVDEPTEGRRRR
jgi:hypothetical protein